MRTLATNLRTHQKHLRKLKSVNSYFQVYCVSILPQRFYWIAKNTFFLVGSKENFKNFYHELKYNRNLYRNLKNRKYFYIKRKYVLGY